MAWWCAAQLAVGAAASGYFPGGGQFFGGTGRMGVGGGGPDVDNEALYAELGLSRGAEPSVAEVTKAYRTAAVRCHPDKGGDPEAFKRISEAYHILADPEKRKLCVVPASSSSATTSSSSASLSSLLVVSSSSSSSLSSSS